MEPVRTHRARSVVEAARLHRARVRRERGLTLVEGPHLIDDVVAAGGVVHERFGLDPTSPGIIPVDERALQRLAGTRSPRGPIAVVEVPKERLDQNRDLLISVGVSDPGNLGTMIRTAASFDWGFAYSSGSADPWAPKTIRSGAGGQFQTAVTSLDDLDMLDSHTVVASVVNGGRSPETIGGSPIALLIGEEAHGLPSDMLERAEQLLTISTPGATESLNAAVAAGIAVYALAKGSPR